ncbi:MAG: hypothetical protein IJ336_03075 [Lachnospiraceae bacterium]|nr:hypothetical protein [Lachnospiraceae bacterium]
MKNLLNVAIYESVLVDGRWYVKNVDSDKIDSSISFGSKILADMLCANMMGYTVSVKECANSELENARTEVA